MSIKRFQCEGCGHYFNEDDVKRVVFGTGHYCFTCLGHTPGVQEGTCCNCNKVKPASELRGALYTGSLICTKCLNDVDDLPLGETIESQYPICGATQNLAAVVYETHAQAHARKMRANGALPCPECGEGWHLNAECYSNDQHFVACKACGVVGPIGEGKRDAIAGWNKLERKSVPCTPDLELKLQIAQARKVCLETAVALEGFGSCINYGEAIVCAKTLARKLRAVCEEVES